MARTHKVAVAASIAALSVANWSSAQTKPPMLTAASFTKAKDFINRTGRPLERARFRFHFEQGSPTEVIAELSKFQNPDGGFATYLESDSRWTGSSPNGTRVALKILTDVKAPPTDPRVQATVKYLLSTFDESNGTWRALPKEANTAPHAPWWHVHEETGKCDVDSLVFPAAAFAGYLQHYDALVPRDFLKRITDASLNDLADAPMKMQMSDIDMLSELVRLLPSNHPQREVAVQKLRTVLAAVVERDPDKWTTYGLQPLSFIASPHSPFYPGLEKEAAVNLDYILHTQNQDGGWPLNWSWAEVDPAAWKIAEKEWRAVMTLEKLERLEGFHRIQR
jgi:prenyltransferase/squalene oxidase-like repeat protein